MIDFTQQKIDLTLIVEVLEKLNMVSMAETVRNQLKILDDFNKRDASTIILGMLPGKDGEPYAVNAEDLDDINEFVDFATDAMNGLDRNPLDGWLVELMRARSQDVSHIQPLITNEEES